MIHLSMTHPSTTTDPRTRIALFVPNLDGGGAECMMVHLASGFAERGFRANPVLADALGLSGVRTEDEKCTDLGASASKPGIADAVSPPGFSRLSAALLASLTAPTDPVLRAGLGRSTFRRRKSFPSISRYCYPGKARRMASLQLTGAHLRASAPSVPTRPL